jgi:hypothetical protein
VTIAQNDSPTPANELRAAEECDNARQDKCPQTLNVNGPCIATRPRFLGLSGSSDGSCWPVLVSPCHPSHVYLDVDRGKGHGFRVAMLVSRRLGP